MEDSKAHFYERLGHQYTQSISQYDTQRRVEILIDKFLTNDQLSGKQILDLGCGLGYFSKRLKERGAIVTACDIGASLVETTVRSVGCRGVVADALQLSSHFGMEQFDGIVSSECVEHTACPEKAISEMARVLRPEGFLALSTPNKIWYPVVRMATLLHLRPYDGYENFSSFGSLKKTLKKNQLNICDAYGLHIFPFQFGFESLSRWCDQHIQFMRNIMLNLCVLAVKRGSN